MIDNTIETKTPKADPAAVFAAALSLWEACNEAAKNDSSLDLSGKFNGIDQMMREVMRIADLFESWACSHVVFEQLDDVWPYRLENDFGPTCLKLIHPEGLIEFDEDYCLRVALELRLPLRFSDGLRVPIDVRVANPNPDSEFIQFRIQTCRDHCQDGDSHPYWIGDEPFDEEFTAPYFSLYGVAIDGLCEHITDRRNYAEITALARKLDPDLRFPDFPTNVGIIRPSAESGTSDS
jgi:hypothetical protein